MDTEHTEDREQQHPDGRYIPTNEEILARIEPLTSQQQRQTQARHLAVNLLALGMGLIVFTAIILIVTSTQEDPQPSIGILSGDIFMRNDNDYRGGVILRQEGQPDAFMVVRTNVTGKVVQLKRVHGITGSSDSLTADQHTYTKYPVRAWAPVNKDMPIPGLYVTEYGEYDDSTGLIAVFYEGHLIIGVKMTGNQHVPAGKKTFIINMTDNMAIKMQHANIGFKNARWVEEGYMLDEKSPTSKYFKIRNTRHQHWDCEFYHITELRPQMLH